MSDHHHYLLRLACLCHPDDYRPYGDRERDGPDCSGGCLCYYPLEDRGGNPLSQDWGVCANTASHRRGLLTFEHQGCRHFVPSCRVGGVEDLTDEEMQAIIDAKVPPEEDQE